MMTKLILASASPRRREILDMAGFAFAVCPARGEEVRVGADPVEIVENLAKAKAREVAGSQKEDCLVLGADTIVVLDGGDHGKTGRPGGCQPYAGMRCRVDLTRCIPAWRWMRCGRACTLCTVSCSGQTCLSIR